MEDILPTTQEEADKLEAIIHQSQSNFVLTEEAKPTVEDQAAYDFRKLLPIFWSKIEPMSRRQQQRVFQALIEYPLEDSFPKFSYPVEREAFYIGLQLNDCKFILMTAVANMAKSKEALDKFQQEVNELQKQQAEEELKIQDAIQGGLSS